MKRTTPTVLLIAILTHTTWAFADDEVEAFCVELENAVVQNAGACDQMAFAVDATIDAHRDTLPRIKATNDATAEVCVSHMERALDDLMACASDEKLRSSLSRLESTRSTDPKTPRETVTAELRRLAGHATSWIRTEQSGQLFPAALDTVCSQTHPEHAAWTDLRVAPPSTVTVCYKTTEDRTQFAATAEKDGVMVCIDGVVVGDKIQFSDVRATESHDACLQ